MSPSAASYEIAVARPRDLAALPAIERAAAQLLRGHAPQSVLDEVTSDDDFRHAQAAGRLWVARVDDVPVGFALVEMLAADLPHLDEIDVLPEHGRRGLGAALIDAVCAWARASGYRALTLTTFRRVPWNAPFYARMGFEEVVVSQLRPELAAVVDGETTRGLDPERRVVMQLILDR